MSKAITVDGNAASLHAMISKTVRAEFPDANVVDVQVEESVDADGDPVLKITVIFETSADIDPRKTPGLVRNVRPELQKRHDGRFPMFRLMTKKDAARMQPEAA